jgi:hypothetical protein
MERIGTHLQKAMSYGSGDPLTSNRLWPTWKGSPLSYRHGLGWNKRPVFDCPQFWLSY